MTIAELNDAFRRSFTGGQVFVTRGISALPQDAQAAITARVRSFEKFDENNEHDFGSFELVSRKFFWKIDYYDKRCEFGSDDPADLDKTTRVLTIMLAEEY